MRLNWFGYFDEADRASFLYKKKYNFFFTLILPYTTATGSKRQGGFNFRSLEPTVRRRGSKRATAYDMAVGRRVRAQRLARKMSQSALADELGISFQQLQKYEKGMNRVSAGRLQQIAAIFGIPVNTLFGSESAKGRKQTAAIAFLDTAGAMRLMRAYAAIRKPRMKRALVELAEQIGGNVP